MSDFTKKTTICFIFGYPIHNKDSSTLAYVRTSPDKFVILFYSEGGFPYENPD